MDFTSIPNAAGKPGRLNGTPPNLPSSLVATLRILGSAANTPAIGRIVNLFVTRLTILRTRHSIEHLPLLAVAAPARIPVSLVDLGGSKRTTEKRSRKDRFLALRARLEKKDLYPPERVVA
jgi:hypothetical protein